MRQVPKFYTDGEKTDAYTEKELTALAATFEQAELAWREDGGKLKDEGTSVLGAGLQVFAVKNRARICRPRTVVRATFQGNVRNSRSKERAMKILADAGVTGVRYFDGYTD